MMDYNITLCIANLSDGIHYLSCSICTLYIVHSAHFLPSDGTFSMAKNDRGSPIGKS